jgi:hypothetical protein
MGAYTVPTRGQRTASQGMTKWNIIQMRDYTVPIRGQRTTSRMGAYTVPTRGQRTASREITKWNMIQMGAYNVPTRGQRTASRETTKGSRIQTRIWPPTLNTEIHGILIAQIWIKNLNHIKNSKNIILNKIKHSNTAARQMTGSVENRQVKMRSVYTDQRKYNPLVWLYKTISDWDHPVRLSTLSHAFNAWLTIQLNW